MDTRTDRIPLIEMNGIDKYFTAGKSNKIHVLKSLNLKIYEGDFVVIMGKSGSGKTTLMNLIGLLDKTTSGEYLFQGKNVSNLNEGKKSEFRNNYFGFIFQQFFLINSLNVIQNVMLPCTYTKGTKLKEKTDEAERLLGLVGLDTKYKSKVTELSGGQQQRVAIARSLVNEPMLIMADEPTGALDSETGEEVMQILKKLNEEGKTIIMVTHDEDMVNYANRIFRMKDGSFLESEEIA